MDLHNNTPRASMRFVNGDFNVSFSYNVNTNPLIIEDAGTGIMWVKALDISIQANPDMRDGRF